MGKISNKHPYSDTKAFERLMLLIATLIHYPGVGYRDVDLKEANGSHHNALKEVQSYMRHLAKTCGIELSSNYPAIPTLRKDLEFLRDCHLLEHRMYRWGYYLGTGVMTSQELKAAFNALESQALYQGDPQIRQIYSQLKRRLRGYELPANDNFFYPVRQHLNRAINYTDPEEMMEKGQYRHTLYHHIPTLETAIAQGQAVEIFRSKDFYGNSRLGPLTIWPLQLIYHDIAWYLLFECCNNKHLIIGRVNRYGDACSIIKPQGRGSTAQSQSLKNAYKLLKNGWGLKLGSLEEQILELQGKMPFIAAKIRFFPPISYFIEEGECRHPYQQLKKGKKDPQTGKPLYIDYCINLPPRSFDEFSIWIQQYADKAQVISPPQLVEKHRQSALALTHRYQLLKDNLT